MVLSQLVTYIQYPSWGKYHTKRIKDLVRLDFGFFICLIFCQILFLISTQVWFFLISKNEALCLTFTFLSIFFRLFLKR